MKKFLTSHFLLLTFLASCTMAPKYERPKADVPFNEKKSEKQKISQISWEKYFQSKDLQRLIKLALENNRDLKIANLNIESALANHNVVRADLFPNIGAVGARTRQGAPKAFAPFTPETVYRSNLSLSSYELDFFGKLRSLKSAAFEKFLASEQSRNIIRISLISEVVNTYTQLLVDNEVLAIAKDNLDLQSLRYEIISAKYNFGTASKSDQMLAKTDLENSRSTYESYRLIAAQDKNLLLQLCGTFDETILPKITSVDELKINESLLDFVASENLLLRPDVQMAEHNLKSANANIGAARAAFFPSITLTGTYGFSGTESATLFSPDFKTWSLTPQINLPIFSGGRNWANLKLSEAEKKIAIEEYQKAIQTAFRETLDELENRKSVFNLLRSSNEILKSREESFKISQARFSSGINSKSEMIDDKMLYLAAKQSQLNTKREYILNLINLYKVLGGGSEIATAEENKKAEELKKKK
jgi:multidrug efflux system outer membrane protein